VLEAAAAAGGGGLIQKLLIGPNPCPGYRTQYRTYVAESDGPKDHECQLGLRIIHECGSTYLRFLDCESPIVSQHLIKGRHLEECSKLLSSLVPKLVFSIVLNFQTLYLMIPSKTMLSCSWAVQAETTGLRQSG
jgi:hypothetical protein